MDYSLLNILSDEMPTRQKIMICALRLFSSKGYAETTIRDIASAVGITPGSIYGHFNSKEELLHYMLTDYEEYTHEMFSKVDIVPILEERPTGEGITMCFMASVSSLTESVYYANLVHLIHQEQHRNALFGRFVLLRLQETTEFIERIFRVLKDMNIIRDDANAEYWGAYTYSLMHMLSTLTALHIVLGSKGISINDIVPLLQHLFDALIDAYGV